MLYSKQAFFLERLVYGCYQFVFVFVYIGFYGDVGVFVSGKELG
jgi:hypothetical protein